MVYWLLCTLDLPTREGNLHRCCPRPSAPPLATRCTSSSRNTLNTQGAKGWLDAGNPDYMSPLGRRPLWPNTAQTHARPIQRCAEYKRNCWTKPCLAFFNVVAESRLYDAETHRFHSPARGNHFALALVALVGPSWGETMVVFTGGVWYSSGIWDTI
jgi:hypothetical protein